MQNLNLHLNVFVAITSLVVLSKSQLCGNRDRISLKLIGNTIINNTCGQESIDISKNVLYNQPSSNYPGDSSSEFVCTKPTQFPTEKGMKRGGLVPSLITLSLCLLLILNYNYTKWTRVGRMLSKFKGPRPLPIIGNLHLFAVPPEEIIPVFSNFFDKYGPRGIFWFMNLPIIALVQAEDVEKVLCSSKHLQKGKLYWIVKWFFGDGLATSDVQTWKVDRKLMDPTFKYQRFDGFLHTFNKHGNIFVDILGNKIKLDNSEIDVLPLLKMCTMDSIIESTFGVDSDVQNNPSPVVIEAFDTVIESAHERSVKPYLLILPIIWDKFGYGKQEKKAIQFFKHLKTTSFEARNLLGENRDLDSEITKPFMEVLRNKSDQHILDHMLTFFAGGFETSSTAINFTLYMLALHTEHQEKVQEELDAIFANDRERPVTFADLAEMKYLEMSIKETLRFYPSVPTMLRSIQSDIQLDDDLVIPGGTEVFIGIYHLHRDPRVFPDPEKFDPLRFLPSECCRRHRAAYIPFSLGPRNCIGQKYGMMQMKVLLSYVLRKFSVSTTLKMEDWKPVLGGSLGSSVSLHLKLSKRL